MKMKRERRWLRAGMMLLMFGTASCSSGLPPMPADSKEPTSGEHTSGASGSGTTVGSAGAAAAGSGAPAEQVGAGAASMPAPAGSSSEITSASGMRNVGEPCPMGEVDCRPGLRCVETVVGSRTVRRCAPPCTPGEEDECTPEDDSED